MKKIFFTLLLTFTLVGVSKATNPVIYLDAYGSFYGSTFDNIHSVATDNNDYIIKVHVPTGQRIHFGAALYMYPGDRMEVMETDDTFTYLGAGNTWYGGAGYVDYLCLSDVNLIVKYIKDPNITNRDNSYGWEMYVDCLY